ncbi:MAG: N-acetyl-gamma-glutamyl-phosphate reductase [Bacteroidetes bacterium MedPE-SWsnd-G2]|nr:MAG: N-acetyl-gamma-glutamyl-phosphate reductase [Bacteroidetes bacterium MedPE-SWsnd-G2]
MLIIILFLVFSIPAVQTGLGKYATDRLNKDFNTNININKLGLQLNGDVKVEQIYIEDHHQDTLIAIEKLNTSILNFKKLFESRLTFGDINIDGLVFNVKTYEGEQDANLDVFVASFDDDKPRTGKSNFLMSSSDVSINGGTFRLIDENTETRDIFEFVDLDINATDFLINGSDVSARINQLSFTDSRGLRIERMSTNFQYTLTKMSFENLKIKTPNSNLAGRLQFDYDRKDFKDFSNKVNVKASFRDSKVSLDELNVFYNEFGKNQSTEFNADLSGTLNNLSATNLNLKSGNSTKIVGDLNFKNLFSKAENDFSMDGDFERLTSSYIDLNELLPNVLGKSIPSIFDKLGKFTLQGTTAVTNTTVAADLDLVTELGFINANLDMIRVNEIDNSSYKGNIIFEEFDLGQFIGNPDVNLASFNIEVDGNGFTLENLDTQVLGTVSSIEYNAYNYQDLSISGQLGNNIFNGVLISNDENFRLKFDGLADLTKTENVFNFNANVEYADLKTLNFTSNDELSIFKGNINMSVTGSTIDNSRGTVVVKNTTYENEYGHYFFEDFTITSVFEGKERLITINSPDIIQGQVQGHFKVRDVPRLIENSLGYIYSNYEPHIAEENQYLNFNFIINSKIAEVFYHDINIGLNTTLKGRIETNEEGFRLNFKSPKIKILDYFASDIDLQIDNSNPLYNTYIGIDSVNTKYYDVSKFNLINVTLRDTLFIKSEFQGGKYNDDFYDINLFYTINEDNKSVLGFKKSDITFKENDWYINREENKQNKIVFDREFKNIDLEKIVMSHRGEDMELKGFVRDTAKNISLNFKDVDLVKITPPIDSLKLAGTINGKLELIQKNDIFLPYSNLSISDFEANDYELGDLKTKIEGNQSLTNYTVDVTLENNIMKSLDAKGTIDLSNNNSNIDLDIYLNEFILNPLNPFGEGVITNIRGDATGNAKVTGALEKPDITGSLILNNAGLTIPYLNVDYSFDFDSEVKLEGQQFLFQNNTLTDSEYFSQANLNGFVAHTNFSDWKLGLELTTDRLLVLNTKDSEESLYYGTAFIDGRADITGPADQLLIDVEGRTGEGTVFKIPLNDVESFGDNSYIHFLTQEEKDAISQGKEIKDIKVSGLELAFDLDVTPDAEIEIVIDKNTGSTIKGIGEGNLLFEINTNDKFNMWGDFSVFEGTYNFIYGGLFLKEFDVEPGGKLEWEGDPLNAQINIKAIYKTEANPSVLLDSPINRRIPVEVGINLTGQLEQPNPEFSFNFPNTGSTIESELQYRLESKEERERQALYLLAIGTFANDAALGSNAYGTIEDRVNNLINSWFENEDGKLVVGVNIQAKEDTPEYQTDTQLGLTFKTNISDRVLINGKVGVPVGGVSETVIGGDVQMDILINEKGTLVAKVFNRENSIRNFGEEIGYTQGVGITYNVEFDTFKELIQIIFTKKNKDKASKNKTKVEDNSDEEKLPSYIRTTDSNQEINN